MRQVVITGLGVISPLGEGIDAFAAKLTSGRSALEPITGFETSEYHSHLGAEVRDFKAETYLGRKTRGLNRTTKFLTAAMKLAIEEARLTPEETSASGVVVGTGFGNSAHAITYAQKLLCQGPEEMLPLDTMDMPSNSSVNFVSVFFGIREFARTISAGFTSSHDALGNAFGLIQSGRAERIIIAGMEQLSPELFTLFHQQGLLARASADLPEATRPFDERRNGFVLGEGGYALVVEAAAVARERGATPLAAITGYANAFIGSRRLTEPARLERICAIMQSALQAAGRQPSQIDLISAAANGTDLDCLEAQAIAQLFAPEPPPLQAIKAQLGEAFGAAGALQAVVATWQLATGTPAAPVAVERPDPRCPPALTGKNPLVKGLQMVIISGLDLAGNYACLILEKA